MSGPRSAGIVTLHPYPRDKGRCSACRGESRARGLGVLLYTDDADRTALAVTERGVVPEATVTRRSTLEDVFLRLTGRRLVD